MTLRTGRSALLVAVAVAMVVAGCGGEDEETGQRNSEETTTQTSDPVITAPPTKSPEEKAEAEIIKTFEGLIADRDEYYSNASDYDAAEVETNAPSTQWRVTGQADLELSNWTRAWRRAELEQVGDSVIATHDVATVELSDSGSHSAQSTVCLDMRGLKVEDYEGQPADPSYEADKFQTWTMTWAYIAEAAPEAGIEEVGWHIQTLDLTRNQPC